MNIYQIIVYIEIAIVVYLAIGLIPLIIHALFWAKKSGHSFRNRMGHIFHGFFTKVNGVYQGVPIWITWLLFPIFWLVFGILALKLFLQRKAKKE